MTHFAHVPNLASSLSSPISESSSCSSPVHSRFSSSSTSAASEAESLEEWDAVQAHLAYARRMADHTASMWQKERLAIEKAKLEGTYTGNMTSRQNGNARPPKDDEVKTAGSSTASEKKKARGFGGFLASIFSPVADGEPQRGRSRRRSQ
ncbi:hypothetical protein PHBOTO_000505 [Pseudozyma hubeiensis]|nr:hypothetical protein PHBOTO_000505 [Pseudozyma hubeiensis]